MRAVYFEARLLDGLGYVRESEKLFRQAVKTCFDHEQYKEAFITLLTLFECLCRRGALGKAAALCEEAIAATSQAGEACNEQIRRAWEELLAAVRVRQLSESELIQARQYLVRNWSVPAGAFVLSKLEPAVTSPSSALPAPPPLLTGPRAKSTTGISSPQPWNRPEAISARPAAVSAWRATRSREECAGMGCELEGSTRTFEGRTLRVWGHTRTFGGRTPAR